MNNLPYDDLDKAIEDYKTLGLKVMITELDITMGRRRTAWRPTAGRGSRAAEEQLKAQADAYADFSRSSASKDVVTR